MHGFLLFILPSMLPVLQYLEDDNIRKEVWTASDSLCVNAPYDNEPLIRQIIKLRQEKAEILGKNNFADAVLSRRMAQNGEKADSFVTELREKTDPFFQRENKELEDFKAEKTGSSPDALEPWEVGFWSEKLKKERYDLTMTYALTFLSNRFLMACLNWQPKFLV